MKMITGRLTGTVFSSSNFPHLGRSFVPWKIVRTCAIPKVQKISSNNDLRPISILPSLSKIFERLVLRQMSDFVTNTTTGVLNQSISAYRKGHMHYDSYVGNARWYSASYEKRWSHDSCSRRFLESVRYCVLLYGHAIVFYWKLKHS